MAEILTELFCERCGTRYTFEPVDNRRKRLSAFGTLGRGIRHFVSDPGSSLDEAFAVARSETEQRSTSSALEAFHRTFNFCLSCRQYTCADCWNTVEGRCLSCAPTPDAAPPETRVDTPALLAPMNLAMASAPGEVEPVMAESVLADAGEPATLDLAAIRAQARAAAEAEALAESGSTTEADPDGGAISQAEAEAAALEDSAAVAQADARAASLAAEAETEAAAETAAAETAAAEAAQAAAAEAAAAEAEAAAAEAAAEAQAAADTEARAAAEAAAAEAAAADAAAAEAAAAEAKAAADAAADTQAAADAQAAAGAQAAALVLAFEPGRNLDDEIAEYERQRAEAAALAASVADLAPVSEVAADDAAAEAVEVLEAAQAVVEPELQAIEAAPAEAEPELEVEAAPIEPGRVPPPIEPIPTAIGQPLPASAVQGPLSWPDPEVAAAAFEPHWPDVPVTRRRSRLQPAPPSALPAAARACPSCGLSLSASARFCRRCGTPQQVDAPH